MVGFLLVASSASRLFVPLLSHGPRSVDLAETSGWFLVVSLTCTPVCPTIILPVPFPSASCPGFSQKLTLLSPDSCSHTWTTEAAPKYPPSLGPLASTRRTYLQHASHVHVMLEARVGQSEGQSPSWVQGATQTAKVLGTILTATPPPLTAGVNQIQYFKKCKS